MTARVTEEDEPISGGPGHYNWSGVSPIDLHITVKDKSISVARLPTYHLQFGF